MLPIRVAESLQLNREHQSRITSVVGIVNWVSGKDLSSRGDILVVGTVFKIAEGEQRWWAFISRCCSIGVGLNSVDVAEVHRNDFR